MAEFFSEKSENPKVWKTVVFSCNSKREKFFFGTKLVVLMASVKHKDTTRKKKTKRVCKLAREFTNQLLVKVKQLSDYDP